MVSIPSEQTAAQVADVTGVTAAGRGLCAQAFKPIQFLQPKLDELYYIF